MGRAPRPQAPTADLLGLRQPAPPSAIHDRKLRTVRDLACFGRRTYLRIEIVRVACPVCGVRVERLGFLHSNPRHSRRFAYQVARLCLAMPVSSAAAVAAISWDAARGLLESVSAAALKPLEPPEDLRWIGVDEKSWRRGRRFCTVVSDLESGRVIWLAPGHSGEALAEFFAWLGERRSERIEAAAIDLSHSYEETIPVTAPGPRSSMTATTSQSCSSRRSTTSESRSSRRPPQKSGRF